MISVVVGNVVLMVMSLPGSDRLMDGRSVGSVGGDGAKAERRAASASEAACWASYSVVGSAIGRPITADSVSMSKKVPASSSSRVPSSVRLDWKMPAAERGRKSS